MNKADFLTGLARLTDAAGLVCEPAAMQPYLTDWRGLRQGTALAVVRPTDTAQVSRIVQHCARHAVGIIPQGGNTGLTFATTDAAPGPRILLSLSRMNAIRSLDRTGMTIEVEAGCILQIAKAAAHRVQRMLPISLAAEGSAQIGGVLATNAGGVNVLRHGMARQMVLGLEGVLADGSILNGLRALRKDNAGYDWKQLLIGSEGTLGVITAATLRLSPLPRHSEVAFLSVPSVEHALDLLAFMHDELGDTISAFELIADAGLALVERHFGLRRPVAESPWAVLIEAQSSLPGLRAAVENALAEGFARGLAVDGVLAENQTQAATLWNLREHLTEAEQREGQSLKHDIAVPIPLMARFLADATQQVLALDPRARLNPFGHLGDGNIHFNVLLPDPANSDAVSTAVHRLAIDMGGSVTAEHGIGRYRMAALAQMRGPEQMALMRRLKSALDPDWLLNPGAVLLRDSG